VAPAPTLGSGPSLRFLFTDDPKIAEKLVLCLTVLSLERGLHVYIIAQTTSSERRKIQTKTKQQNNLKIINLLI